MEKSIPVSLIWLRRKSPILLAGSALVPAACGGASGTVSPDHTGDLMRLGAVETGLLALQRPGPLHLRIERMPD